MKNEIMGVDPRDGDNKNNPDISSAGSISNDKIIAQSIQKGKGYDAHFLRLSVQFLHFQKTGGQR